MTPVELKHAHRLMNHGPTVLVGSAHTGRINVMAAWADERVFSEGRWHFEDAAPELRSLHHVSGGHFYAIGEAVQALPVVNA
jgi:hypothetical protein